MHPFYPLKQYNYFPLQSNTALSSMIANLGNNSKKKIVLLNCVGDEFLPDYLLHLFLPKILVMLLFTGIETLRICKFNRQEHPLCNPCVS